MLFLTSLDKLPRDDKVMLLTQLEVLTSWNILNDGSRRGLEKSKQAVLRATGRVMKKELSQEVGSAKFLQKKLEAKHMLVADMSLREIDMHLKDHLIVLANVDRRSNTEAIARGILYRAARSLEIDPENYVNLVTLENDVFDNTVKWIMEDIKDRLAGMSLEEEVELERLLREELENLNRVEQDAIKDLTGLEELSGKSLMRFFKTTSSAAMAQLVLGGLGFGSYLFLSTMIKAVSLLFGTTFSFATYTTAATMLSFTLSSWFLLGFAVLSAGFVYKGTGNALGDQLARMVVMVGRSSEEVNNK